MKLATRSSRSTRSSAKPLDPATLRAARRRRSLLRLRWPERELPAVGEEGPIAILGEAGIEGIAAEPYAALAALLEAIEAGAEVPKTVLLDTRAWPGATDELPSAAHDNAARALAAAKAWLAAEALGSSRLLFLTEAAVALPGEGEGANLATAPLWGLLRSAQAEYPGRFALLDLDSEEASLEALPAALALADEPQLALRDGVAHVPRLSRASEGEEERGTPIDPESTVLISGGTGGLGALVARHLVTEHAARNLLLISRRGGAAPGADRAACRAGGARRQDHDRRL